MILSLKNTVSLLKCVINNSRLLIIGQYFCITIEEMETYLTESIIEVLFDGILCIIVGRRLHSRESTASTKSECSCEYNCVF